MTTKTIIIQFISDNNLRGISKKIVEKLTGSFGICDDFSITVRNITYRYIISNTFVNSDIIIVLMNDEYIELKRINYNVSPPMRIPTYHLNIVNANHNISDLDEIRKNCKFPIFHFSLDESYLKKQMNIGNLCISELCVGTDTLILTKLELEKVIGVKTIGYLLEKCISTHTF